MDYDPIYTAELTWGPHPFSWPCPPEKRPRWWQRKAVQRLRELEAVFGHLDDNALQRYWQEARKGQSVYEDAGGYMIRCYEAMIGKQTDEPTPYDSYLANILSGALNQSLTSAGKIG